MESPGRHVTLEEAEQFLPRVEQLVRQLQILRREIELLDTVEIQVSQQQYQQIKHLTHFNKQFHKLSYQFYSKLHQLETLGCLLKDLHTGLVDFVSTFEGRDIFLCWKLGEESIQHWHEVDNGFAGRQRIVDLR